MYPSPATCADFGISSPQQLGALRYAEVTEYELDRVLGDGEAITKLVRTFGDFSYGAPRYETPSSTITATL